MNIWAQKHRYIKCENFVAMVTETPLKPAFSPPSLHKMEKICSDGICHGRPDLAPDLASGLKQGLKPDQPCRSDKDVEIRYMRVIQYTESQAVTLNACLPRYAGIWLKSLICMYLQNTLGSRPDDDLPTKTFGDDIPVYANQE